MSDVERFLTYCYRPIIDTGHSIRVNSRHHASFKRVFLMLLHKGINFLAMLFSVTVLFRVCFLQMFSSSPSKNSQYVLSEVYNNTYTKQRVKPSSSAEVENEQELYLVSPLAPAWCSGAALLYFYF
jgi:hypothetical protein